MPNATAKIITASTPDGKTGDVLQLKNCSYASFRLADLIIEADKAYTFTIKLKSSSSTTVNFSVLGYECDPVTVTPTWQEVHFVIEKPLQNFVLISPTSDADILLWQAMLQSGTVSTGWVPAPEDTGDQIEEITEKYSILNQDVDGIRAEVSELKTNADGTYALKTELMQTAKDIRLEAQSSSVAADKKYATKSELKVSADEINSNVTDQISEVSSEIKQLSESITLQVVKADGTKTNIKISSDGIIQLNGATMAQYIDVDKLMARDMTATGTFNVDNGKYVLTADANEVRVGRPNPSPDDTFYFPNQIVFNQNSLSIGGAGQRNMVDVNISGNVSMYGNLTLRSGGAWYPVFTLEYSDAGSGWVGYSNGATENTQTEGVGIGTTNGGYIITTDSGVRAQIGDYSFYVTKNGQARITGSGGMIQLEKNGVYITGPLYHRDSSSDSWKKI